MKHLIIITLITITNLNSLHSQKIIEKNIAYKIKL